MNPATLKKQQHLATVGLGSNLGNREALLSEAVKHLEAPGGNRLIKASSVYETEPFGKVDQDWFLNGVVQMETSLDMKAFFHLLQDVETRLGRERKEHWGPRTLDLDLLFFDNVVFSDHELTLPHPGIPARRFVLEPLLEISPDLIHPSLGKTVRELLQETRDACKANRLAGVPLVANAGEGQPGHS
jgi:dihydroneopterin aldolase / 2-amino-4-hydroxy-6-hydroxymethyldihydropteridine diphosphokinase